MRLQRPTAFRLVLIELIFVLVLLVACGSDHKVIEASDLAASYDKDPRTAESKYSGRRVTLRGIAFRTSVARDTRQLLLLKGSKQTNVVCVAPKGSSYENAFGSLGPIDEEGKNVTVEGRVTDLILAGPNALIIEDCTVIQVQG